MLADVAVVIVMSIASDQIEHHALARRRFNACLDALGLKPGSNPTNANITPETCPENTYEEALGYPTVAGDDETVPTLTLILILVFVPIGLGIVVQVGFSRVKALRWEWLHDLHNFYMATAYAASVCAFVTFIFKHEVGRFRPDFYNVYSEGTSYYIKDAAEAYPSGHSSLSMCVCWTGALYLLGKFKALVPGHQRPAAAVPSLALVLFAAWIACTRVIDYRHNPSDINAGMLLGALISTLFYFTYFPSLTDPDADLPVVHYYARLRAERRGGRASGPR